MTNEQRFQEMLRLIEKMNAKIKKLEAVTGASRKVLGAEHLYAQIDKYCMENGKSINAFTRDLWRKKFVKLRKALENDDK